jgi:dihydroorotate dehydrogenase
MPSGRFNAALNHRFVLIYSLLYKLLLGRLDVERAHALAARTLRLVTAIGPLAWLLHRSLGRAYPSLRVHALGLDFPSPLGVAAGVDKDASWFDGLGLLGFGFVEIGTVTALAQPGNQRPRVFRMMRDRALINSMGFPNPGAHTVAERLRNSPRHTILGVNVGKSKVAPMESAGEDYRRSVELLAPFADYLVVNVSSPNTPGLRELQKVELLEPIISEVRSELEAAGVKVPLLLKIAPDLTDNQLDTLADFALALSLEGIVAVNTTLDRTGLVHSRELSARIDAGGVSGAPLRARSLEVLQRLRARVGDRLVLISVGGIETSEDAWQRILAGATLVQAYTGFVYNGPAWPGRMNRELAHRVREHGCSSIQELVGNDTPVANPPVAKRGSGLPG